MKVVFTDSVPKGEKYSKYVFDETLVNDANYVNIKNIVNENEVDWLNDLADSHLEISKIASRKTRWWWVSFASRLDLRPWGQEKIIKPLIFSMAILDWFSKNNCSSLVLIDCPNEVAEYLAELEPKVIIERNSKSSKKRLITTLYNTLLITVKSASRILFFHVLKKPQKIVVEEKNLIAYELVHGSDIKSSYRYYFTNILDNIDEKLICHFVIGVVKNHNRPEYKNEYARQIIAFDSCTISDLIKSLFFTLYLQFCLFYLIINKPSCVINNKKTKNYWNKHLMFMLDINVLENIVLYFAISKLFKDVSIKQLIYPYEEKGSERSMLFAAKENNIKTIGFTPHPQHSLALSMRDLKDSTCPKPDAYAFCGDEYISYFRKWGSKNKCEMKVWGTQKGSLLEQPNINKNLEDKIKVLLLLSHPNELRMFYKWLQKQPQLCEIAEFQLRSYKAVSDLHFNKFVSMLIKEFPNVIEVSGTLMSNVENCDVVAFCATSAGIEAINLGRPAFYIDLNEFFQINPCFNDLSDMQASNGAIEFYNKLKEWSEKNDVSKRDLLIKQRRRSTNILSKINEQEILDYLT